MLAVDIVTETITETVNSLFVAIFRALSLGMYQICGGPDSGREYLHDLFLGAGTFVAGFSVREVAKLAPDLGERLGKIGVLPEQNRRNPLQFNLDKPSRGGYVIHAIKRQTPAAWGYGTSSSLCLFIFVGLIPASAGTQAWHIRSDCLHLAATFVELLHVFGAALLVGMSDSSSGNKHRVL